MDWIYGGADDDHLACRKVFLHSKQCKCCDTDKSARNDVAVIHLLQSQYVKSCKLVILTGCKKPEEPVMMRLRNPVDGVEKRSLRCYVAAILTDREHRNRPEKHRCGPFFYSHHLHRGGFTPRLQI